MATSEVQTVSASGDKMRLAVAGALVIAALVAFSMLSAQGSLVQWAGLLVGLAAAGGLHFMQRRRREIFETIVAEYRDFAKQIDLHDIVTIPVSGLKGDNITERSRHTPWYAGPTLMACLETVNVAKPNSLKAVFPVQWVNRPNLDFRGFCGTLAEGHIQAGDAVRVLPSPADLSPAAARPGSSPAPSA